MAMVPGTDHLKGIVCGDELLARKMALEKINGLARQLGQVGQGAGLDLAVLG